MIQNDPREHLRHYYRNPPRYALAVDEPWWWAVLACGADVINVHFETAYRGSLAIVARSQAPMDYHRDCEALVGILKAEGRPTFDAWRCPRGRNGRVVGLVTVTEFYTDETAEGYWFSGPAALGVDKPCMLPNEHSFSFAPSPRSLLQPLPEEKLSALSYCLTSFAAMRNV